MDDRRKKEQKTITLRMGSSDTSDTTTSDAGDTVHGCKDVASDVASSAQLVCARVVVF